VRDSDEEDDDGEEDDGEGDDSYQQGDPRYHELFHIHCATWCLPSFCPASA